MFLKLENHYLNMDNVIDVADNGDYIIIRFNVMNLATQAPQTIRVVGDAAQELRARLDELAQSTRE